MTLKRSDGTRLPMPLSAAAVIRLVIADDKV